MGVHPCDLSPVRRDPDGNVRGTGQKKAGRGRSIFNRPRRVMRLTWPTTAIPLAARRVSGTRCRRLGGFGCLVLHAARAPVLFIFEPSDVFLGIGEALQACVEDGGIGNLM